MVEGEGLSSTILIFLLTSTGMTTTQNTRTHLKIVHLDRSQPLTTKLTTKLTTAPRSVPVSAAISRGRPELERGACRSGIADSGSSTRIRRRTRPGVDVVAAPVVKPHAASSVASGECGGRPDQIRRRSSLSGVRKKVSR
jgi:hypothetical protein